ncbi:MAG: hypothetical protein ACXWUB_08700 [Burkholderiales bacterium]
MSGEGGGKLFLFMAPDLPDDEQSFRGDTLEIMGAKVRLRVRLLDIDAPDAHSRSATAPASRWFRVAAIGSRL